MADEKKQAVHEVEHLKRETIAHASVGDEKMLKLASDELLHKMDQAASNPEEILVQNIIAQLLNDPASYAHAMDTCDGNERKCAQLMLDFMVDNLKYLNRGLPMVKAMGMFNNFCGPDGARTYQRLKWEGKVP